MKPVARRNTGNAGHKIEKKKTRPAIELLDVRTNNPESVGVESKVKPADMQKDRRNESPDFSGFDELVRLGAKCDERGLILRATRNRHQDEDQNVKCKNGVGDDRTTSPKRLKEFIIVLFDHCADLTPFSKMPAACRQSHA